MGEHTERPILFSSAMVQAILAGRKTQTRRVVKPQPFGDMTNALTGVREWLWTKASRLLGRDTPLPIEQLIKFCPYGVPGDRLYVRETWMPAINDERSIIYRADGEFDGQEHYEYDGAWKPSIHMPRWASRITLEIEQVRVERIQEITETDAIAEGRANADHPDFHVGNFRDYWNLLNEKRGFGWEANPLVWVLTFKRV